MSEPTMAMRASRAFATPVALSLAAHAFVVGVVLMLPGREAPPPVKDIISNVTLEVRPPAKPPPPPVAAPLPHRDLPPPPKPPPRPVVAKKLPPERLPPPKPKLAPPLEVKKLAEVRRAPVAPPKLGVLPDLPGDKMIVAAGDPHGDPHGHPHVTAPVPALVEPALTEPEPIPLPPPLEPPPPKIEPPLRRGPVPVKLLSRRPEKIEIVKADYPVDARSAGKEGVVVLSLLLDEEGRVRDARVKKRLGYGLDEAAREALLKSRFTPALDQRGAPCSTRIVYRYEFTLD